MGKSTMADSFATLLKEASLPGLLESFWKLFCIQTPISTILVRVIYNGKGSSNLHGYSLFFSRSIYSSIFVVF